jgi:hypothetical protein
VHGTRLPSLFGPNATAPDGAVALRISAVLTRAKQLFRDTLLRLLASSNLEHKELTKEKAA